MSARPITEEEFNQFANMARRIVEELGHLRAAFDGIRGKCGIVPTASVSLAAWVIADAVENAIDDAARLHKEKLEALRERDEAQAKLDVTKILLGDMEKRADSREARAIIAETEVERLKAAIEHPSTCTISMNDPSYVEGYNDALACIERRLEAADTKPIGGPNTTDWCGRCGIGWTKHGPRCDLTKKEPR